MGKGLVLAGFVLFIIGMALGFYASQRNCLIAFLTRGYMSVWTGIEILAGFIALAGLIIALIGFIRRTYFAPRKGKVNRKFLMAIGIPVALAIVGVLCVDQMGITPTDTKIIEVLHENEHNLLSIDGVVGAGIARDEDNHIIGIAVYVEDHVTGIQRIPAELGEFKVLIKTISEASELEKEAIIIRI